MWPFKKKVKEPPVDLNRPVENPNLVTAFEHFQNERNDHNAKKLALELSKAIYLAAIISDEMHITKSDIKGKATFKKDSIIKFFNCYSKNNNNFFPIFTDWNEIKKWIKHPVDSLVMPASDVWSFIESNNSYQGVVINPGSIGWTLNKDNIKAIKEDFSK